MDEATFNSQSRSGCPLTITVFPHLLGIATLGFLVVGISVTSWSYGTVTDVALSTSGGYDIGLWRACSDVSGVFYSGGTCRNGHCNKYNGLVKSTNVVTDEVWNSYDLCDKAAAVQGFLIIAIISSLLSLYKTSFKAAFGWDVQWGVAVFFNILTTICALCAWAIWLEWMNHMNDTNVEGKTFNFTNMKLGNGFNLTIVAFIAAFINIFMCRHRYVLYSQFLNRRKENTERLTNDAPGPYEEDDEYKSDVYLDVEQPIEKKSMEKKPSTSAI